MKKISLIILVLTSFAFAEEVQIPKGCEEVYYKLQKKEKVDCQHIGTLAIGADCECKSLIYSMPGGKGSFDRIVGLKEYTIEKDGMTAEERKLSKAKETYKEAVKEEAEARAEYEISPTDENKVKLDEAKVKLDSAKGQLEQAKEKAKKK